MGKYDILDVAIRKLNVWANSRELDNGIHHLLSGGDMVSVNQWYKEMEEKRTPEQRAVENMQKNSWNDYKKARNEAMKLIKSVQQQPSAHKFYVADYEGEFKQFKAPSMKLARKFLQIIDSNPYAQKDVLPRATAWITEMSIASWGA